MATLPDRDYRGDDIMRVGIAAPSSDDCVVISSSVSRRSDVTALEQLTERIGQLCSRLTPGEVYDSRDKSPKCCCTTEQATQTDLQPASSSASSSSPATSIVSCERHSAELDRIKHKLKEVVDMNVGWQMLHEQREKHVTELTNQLAEMRQKMTSQSPAECNGYHGDTTSNSLTIKCARLEREKQELAAQNMSLLSQLDEARCLVKRLEETVTSLESAICDKESTVEMLQAQAIVYRDDFDCERQDRQRAQGKLVELELELEKLRHHMRTSIVMNQYNSPSEDAIRQHRTVRPAVNKYQVITPRTIRQQPVNEQNPSSIGQAGTVYRQPWNRQDWVYLGLEETDCEVTDAATDSTDESELPVDVEADAAVDIPSTLQTDWSAGVGTDHGLQCPNCRKAFTIDEHVDLMEHLDTCS